MVQRTQEEIMQDWGTDNSDTPLVSVRCITYNHEPYIAQALDGFLIQKTNFPFEVIVHDDASTDRTADIIREYEAKFPKIIKPIYESENQYSKHDGSIARIMNAACKGKYIALCEGDDYWTDERKLQMQVDFLEGNPEYTMCFHNVTSHYENTNQIDSVFSKIRDKDYVSKEIFKNWLIPTCSVVLQRQIFSTSLYTLLRNDPRLIFGDTPLFLSCSEQGKVRGFSKIMGVYRRHEGSAVYGFSFDRNYKHYFHNLALCEKINRISTVVKIYNKKSAAYNCMYALKKRDLYNARRFYRLEEVSNLFLVPLYFIKYLFR